MIIYFTHQTPYHHHISTTHRHLHSFPTRRSSDLAPEDTVFVYARAAQGPRMPLAIVKVQVKDLPYNFTIASGMRGPCAARDRKSTRLNSSHTVISYAVFCLKKKKSQYMKINTRSM